MTLGFTGTQKGLTQKQKVDLLGLLQFFNRTTMFGQKHKLHHGDCVGADEEVHYCALKLNYEIFIHPLVGQSNSASCEGAVKIFLPSEHMIQCQHIVDSCSTLIACPSEETENVDSKTWDITRYAQKVHKPIIKINPIMGFNGRTWWNNDQMEYEDIISGTGMFLVDVGQRLTRL